MMENKIRIITHSGGFHADDVFAMATLLLYLKKDIDAVEVVRTRDQGVIETGDIVIDVGFEYDPVRKRFDHHQEGGAGVRENGIEYASFGLVWKEYGEAITGRAAVARRIDALVVQTIDALDTATLPMESTREDFWLYTVNSLISSFEPEWGAPPEALLDSFKKAVGVAHSVLQNEIRRTIQEEDARDTIVKTYEHAPEKQCIVFSDARGWSRVFINSVLFGFPDTVYFIRQHSDNDSWQVIAVQGPGYSNRRPFPEAWAGKEGVELAKVSGVPDARFCHRGRFMCIAETKDGAMALAEKALNNGI